VSAYNFTSCQKEKQQVILCFANWLAALIKKKKG